MSDSSDHEESWQVRPSQAELDFDLEHALTSIVSLRCLVPEDGLTAEVLGTERAGNGVLVSEDGITPVLENLTQPFGLAQAPDGTIAVAVGATGADDGMIVAVPMN